MVPLGLFELDLRDGSQRLCSNNTRKSSLLSPKDKTVLGKVVSAISVLLGCDSGSRECL